MTNQQRQQLRTAIESAISHTRESIDSLREKTAPIAPDDAIGRLSRMEAINEKSILEANLHQAEQRLLKLHRAQRQIDDEDFGYCQECGDEIPLKRLILIPESDRCVGCAG